MDGAVANPPPFPNLVVPKRIVPEVQQTHTLKHRGWSPRMVAEAAPLFAEHPIRLRLALSVNKRMRDNPVRAYSED